MVFLDVRCRGGPELVLKEANGLVEVVVILIPRTRARFPAGRLLCAGWLSEGKARPVEADGYLISGMRFSIWGRTSPKTACSAGPDAMTRIERMVASLQSLRPTLACLMLMLAGCGGAAPSTSVLPSVHESSQRPKATLVWPAAVGSVAPVWATREGGYFELDGVDIDLQYISGSPKAVAALIGGTAQFVDAPGPAVVSADAAGAHVVMVMAWVDRPAFLFMTTQDIARPEQLKGKTIGVTNVGGSDDFLVRKTLEHFDAPASLKPPISAAVVSRDRRALR